MRAPPESLIPIIGEPVFTARSITLQIFSANTSPSDPPSTVKSCEKRKTCRPSMVAWPVITPSPRNCRSSKPNAVRAVDREAVQLDERAGVDQRLDALARGALAARALFLVRRLAGRGERLGAHRRQARGGVFVRAFGGGHRDDASAPSPGYRCAVPGVVTPLTTT